MIIITWHCQCQVIWINKISVLSAGLPLGFSSLIFMFLLFGGLFCLYHINHHIHFWSFKTNRQSNTQHFEISPKLYFHYLGHIISIDAHTYIWILTHPYNTIAYSLHYVCWIFKSVIYNGPFSDISINLVTILKM